MIVPDKFSYGKAGLLKATIVLFLIFPICDLSAQDSTQGKSFYIGLSVTSGWSKTFYTAPQIPYFYGHPKGITLVRIGFDFKVKFTDHLSLSTGLCADRTGTKGEYTFLPMPVYNGQPVMRPAVSTNSTIFFEMPLRVDIRFNTKRMSPFITAGGYGGIFYQGTNFAEIKYSNGTSQTSITTYNFDPRSSIKNQLYSNFQIGFGLDANMKNFKLQAYPLYEFGFVKAIITPIYRQRFAFALGVAYGF